MSVLQSVSVILLVRVIWSVEGRSLEMSQAEKEKDHAVCDKEECLATAARILDSIDPQTKPCDDFYQFACGGWVKQQVTSPHGDDLSTLYDTDNHVAAFRGLLKADVEESDLEAVKKAKNLYASCVEYGSRSEKRTTKDINKFVKAEFGAWPLAARKWKEKQFDLQNVLAKAARLEVFPLFALGVGVDRYDQDGMLILYHTLAINAPELSLPTSVYTGSDNLALSLYTKKIFSEAKRFGIIDNQQQTAQDVADIIEVERTLAEIIENTAGYDKGQSRLTLADMDEEINTDKFNLTKLVTTLFSAPEVGVSDISTEESVALLNPYYLFNATSYFLDLPPRTQVNFIIWRVLDTFYNIFLNSNEGKLKKLLDQAVLDVISKVTVEESCIDYVSRAFDLVFQRTLNADKRPQEEIAEVYQILNQVQKEFDVVVNEHHWVDQKSRKSILEKNAALGTALINYPQAINDSILDVFYVNVTIDKDDFINNVLFERRENVNRNFRLLRQPYQRSVWEVPHEIIAFHIPHENKVEYTSIVFEPPFYIKNVPTAINYGGVGIVFGHEIVHAFDDSGYLRNKEGREGNWWSNETVAAFQEKSQCLVQQYNNFYYETAGLNVNGKLTLGENMGDQGGMKLAFRAYQKYGKRLETRDKALPGVDYTDDQLFFINFAQRSCNIHSREDAVYLVTNDPHSPAQFRVIGSVQNSPDFARVFNCPVGSNMNPENKCEVW